ncbi:MAG: hypothetical protein Fur0016_07390 [Anaerolineales bacterium]
MDITGNRQPVNRARVVGDDQQRPFRGDILHTMRLYLADEMRQDAARRVAEPTRGHILVELNCDSGKTAASSGEEGVNGARKGCPAPHPRALKISSSNFWLKSRSST